MNTRARARAVFAHRQSSPSWTPLHRAGALLVVAVACAVMAWFGPGRVLFESWARWDLKANGWENGELDMSSAHPARDRRPFYYLKYAPEWKQLAVSGYRLTTQDAADLSSAKHVEAIRFSGCTFEDDALRHLASLPQLTGLSFINCDPNASAFRELAALRKVKRLGFHGGALNGFPFSVVSEIPTLEELSFTGSSLTAAYAASLKNLPRLRVLNLSGTSVDPGIVDVVNEMPTLQHLYLQDTPPTGVPIDGINPSVQVHTRIDEWR